jgi:lipopolysaccharide transport system permease protein
MLDILVECEPPFKAAPSPPKAAGAPPQTEEFPLQVIEPPRGWQLVNFGELWRYRELFYFFTWRDVKIRYKQTLLGAGWAVVQPFLMMVVFTIFLSGMANVDSGEFPYPVFVYAGLLPWTFFATAITTAGNSLLGARQIVTKVYFPRLAVPFASVGAALVDFAIAFSMLLVLMAYYGVQPGWGLLLVPLLVPLLMIAALGVGTLLAALNVAYRDFKYTIPFLVQIWMFATPTVYMNLPQETEQAVAAAKTTVSAAAAESHATKANRQAEDRNRLPAGLKPLLQLNPMTGVIAFFRAAVLGGPLHWDQLAHPLAIIAVLFCGGVAYFRRVESSFADII